MCIISQNLRITSIRVFACKKHEIQWTHSCMLWSLNQLSSLTDLIPNAKIGENSDFNSNELITSVTLPLQTFQTITVWYICKW